MATSCAALSASPGRVVLDCTTCAVFFGDLQQGGHITSMGYGSYSHEIDPFSRSASCKEGCVLLSYSSSCANLSGILVGSCQAPGIRDSHRQRKRTPGALTDHRRYSQAKFSKPLSIFPRLRSSSNRSAASSGIVVPK